MECTYPRNKKGVCSAEKALVKRKKERKNGRGVLGSCRSAGVRFVGCGNLGSLCKP